VSPLLWSGVPSHSLLGRSVSRPVTDRDGSYKVLGSTASNTLEVYRITVPAPSSTQHTLSKLSVLEMHGHRSDVRCVCVSSDGLLIATVSSEGCKLWSTKTYSCIRSCSSGYGVSMTFITGNRYVLIGTKEGRIQIVDSSTGELAVDQEAHEGPVWSVALQPPDGKGFMSGGADKIVKFWDFTVSPPQPLLSSALADLTVP
jgi:U3 small nucleolar RNA-associated protein 12